MTSIVVSHPTGNSNVRAVLRAANDLHALDSFFTTLAFPLGLQNSKFLGASVKQEVARRSFPEVPWQKTILRPMREIARQTVMRSNLFSWTVRHEVGWASVDKVYDALDRDLAQYLHRHAARLAAVYAYEDGALHAFRTARSLGLKTIYDLPIAYWRTLRTILLEESERRPEWASTLEGLQDSAAKLARKEEEIVLAERIVVASSFALRSLRDHFGDSLSVEVIPYGSPAPLVTAPARRQAGQPLHVLYAGHLRQRKGIAYLFEALALADFPWRLTLAGPKPTSVCLALEQALADPRCTWLGAVPHPVLLDAMTKAHVFVFPSLVEGFGLVIPESMAAALPVITTPNTAGPDLITEGVDGHIVPIRDPAAIATRLADLYDDEDRRYRMAEAALTKATSLPWMIYEEEIASLLKRSIAC